MIHAQLDLDNVCIGYSNLKNVEYNENLVYLPEGWNEDFLWRKWDNGWSDSKFTPPTPNPLPTVGELKEQINTLTAMLGDFILGGI